MLSLSAAASALAFTQQWRAETGCCWSIPVPVLAAILAVSGASPWFQDLPQNLLVLTHAAFILLLTSDERRGGEKSSLGPEGMLFCMVPQPTAGLYSQACNTDIAMWLQCCDRFFYTRTLQFSCCFPPTLLRAKELLQVQKP